MIYVLFLLGGVMIGSAISKMISIRNSGYGYFDIEETDDGEHTHKLFVRIPEGQCLSTKETIVLRRKDTHE